MRTSVKTQIGTSVTNEKTGKTMYLYNYRSTDDIDVLFDDGTIATHKRWYNFKRGKIEYPKNKRKMNIDRAMKIMKKRAETFEKEKDSVKHLYEENMSKSGQKMKIVRYGNATDVDIELENGLIIYHKRYDAFKEGSIKDPKMHIGEKNIANNGMPMEITEYHNALNITIKFADGTIVKDQSYYSFKQGMIINPNTYSTVIEKMRKERINSTSTKKDGTVMTCIDYIDSNNITVQFPDGTIRKNISWKSFIRGNVGKQKKKSITNQKNERINTTSTKKDGTVMTCIDYINSHNITVKFPDGSRRTNISWAAFIHGNVQLPEKTTSKNHINQTNTNKNGLKMTIIDHNPNEKPIIKFEDGYVTQKISYHQFKNGYGGHKSLKTTYNGIKGTLYNTKISDIAHSYRNTAHYFCECQICKTREIWNFEQIKNHECNKTAATESENTGTYNA